MEQFALSLQPGNRRFIWWPLAAMLLLFIAALSAFVTSCSRKGGEPVMFTGKTLAQADVRSVAGFIAFLGKDQYAQVNSAWVAWCYDDFRAELSAGQYGVQRWDNRAECTFFATSFEAFAQKRYFAQAFHAAIPAPGIAVGTIWYRPTPTEGHAINVVLTESGLRYFEPQTGQFVTLTGDQVASIYFRKFD